MQDNNTAKKILSNILELDQECDITTNNNGEFKEELQVNPNSKIEVQNNDARNANKIGQKVSCN